MNYTVNTKVITLASKTWTQTVADEQLYKNSICLCLGEFSDRVISRLTQDPFKPIRGLAQLIKSNWVGKNQ